MALAYADTDDLAQYTGEVAPAGAARLLREAAALVRFATRNDLYDVQPSGLPSDDDLREAMRDATCAQVEYWIAAGIDPVGGDITAPAPIRATEVDGAKVEYDTAGQASVSAMAAKTAAVRSLSQGAYLILRNVGLANA